MQVDCWIGKTGAGDLEDGLVIFELEHGGKRPYSRTKMYMVTSMEEILHSSVAVDLAHKNGN